MFYSSKDQKDQVKGILIVYLIGVLFIYLILAIYQGFFFVPAFNADFNRSVIFVTILMGVLLYSEDFEVIIAFCLIGPIIVYAVAAVVSIFLADDAFFGFVGTITLAMSYFFLAGMGALCISVVSAWFANKFRVVQNLKQEGVYKVINLKKEDEMVPNTDLNRLHSPKQMLGIILLELVVLISSVILLILPMYDYGIGSHLYIFDLGLIQVILLLSVSLNAIFLIGAFLLGFYNSELLIRYDSRLLQIQSLYNGVGYFLISVFIPNPSFRVENLMVTSGDGIEFLAFAVFFSFLITPTVIEYFKQTPVQN